MEIVIKQREIMNIVGHYLKSKGMKAVSGRMVGIPGEIQSSLFRPTVIVKQPEFELIVKLQEDWLTDEKLNALQEIGITPTTPK